MVTSKRSSLTTIAASLDNEVNIKTNKVVKIEQPIVTDVPTTAIEHEATPKTTQRNPWGRSRSFAEDTERIPIALPVSLTQALRLKAVMVKKTPSQIIAELLRANL